MHYQCHIFSRSRVIKVHMYTCISYLKSSKQIYWLQPQRVHPIPIIFEIFSLLCTLIEYFLLFFVPSETTNAIGIEYYEGKMECERFYKVRISRFRKLNKIWQRIMCHAFFQSQMLILVLGFDLFTSLGFRLEIFEKELMNSHLISLIGYFLFLVRWNWLLWQATK